MTLLMCSLNHILNGILLGHNKTIKHKHIEADALPTSQHGRFLGEGFIRPLYVKQRLLRAGFTIGKDCYETLSFLARQCYLMGLLHFK